MSYHIAHQEDQQLDSMLFQDGVINNHTQVFMFLFPSRNDPMRSWRYRSYQQSSASILRVACHVSHYHIHINVRRCVWRTKLNHCDYHICPPNFQQPHNLVYDQTSCIFMINLNYKIAVWKSIRRVQLFLLKNPTQRYHMKLSLTLKEHVKKNVLILPGVSRQPHRSYSLSGSKVL